MNIKISRFLVLALCANIIFAGCNQSSSSKIDKIVIGVVGGDDPTERASSFDQLVPYFEKEMGVKKVQIYITSDYASVIEAMRTKKVDIAHLGELAYLMALERAGAEAFAMPGTSEGELYTSSLMLTGSSSDIKSMDDVIKNSKNLRIAFGDPASTSGHLYPRNYLNSIGLEPEQSFKSVLYTPDPSVTIMSAVSQKVDIAFIYSLALNRLIIKERIKKEDVRVLWQSEPYMYAPISVRGDLPKDVKERIQMAYINLAIKEPLVWESYKNRVYTMIPDSLRKKIIYIPSHDTLYKKVKLMALNCKGFKFFHTK